jgi:hypothetical protein
MVPEIETAPRPSLAAMRGLAADQECQEGSPHSPDLRASAAPEVGSRPACDALQDGLRTLEASQIWEGLMRGVELMRGEIRPGGKEPQQAHLGPLDPDVFSAPNSFQDAGQDRCQ